MQGGWQEARGWCDPAFPHANDGTPPPGWKLRPPRMMHGFFVENIKEELTTYREWYADPAEPGGGTSSGASGPAAGSGERMLYYIPEAGVDPNSLNFVASSQVRKRIRIFCGAILYQDRLGTNIGKAPKKRGAFSNRAQCLRLLASRRSSQCVT